MADFCTSIQALSKEIVQCECSLIERDAIYQQTVDMSLHRPVGTKFILGGLKGEASEASKNGGPGAGPRENFLRPRPLDRWKTPHFWKMCC